MPFSTKQTAMKYLKLSAFYAMLSILTLFAGCKKDKDTNPTDSYIGKYVVVTPGSYANYLEITADSIYRMTQTGYYGVRYKEVKAYVAQGDSFTIGFTKYKYTYSNGTLTIHGYVAAVSQPVTFVKSDAAPSGADWVRYAPCTSYGQITNPSSGAFNDMTEYYGHVVTDGHTNGTSYVFKEITLGSGTYTSTEIPVDPLYTSSVGYEDNIEFVNGKFLVYEWGNPNSKIYRVNPSSGLVESSVLVANPVGNIYGLAYDGTDLFGMTYDGIVKFDFVNSSWGAEMQTGGASGAIAGKNGYLYFTVQNQNIIQKFNTTTRLVEAAYSIPSNYSVNGFSMYGNNLVACAYNYTTTKYELIQIQLP